MAIVAPFRAILYNPEIIADLSRVVTPPYDVISSHMQRELYRSHKYNVVRLILSKTSRRDTKSDNRYTRSRRFLEDWLGREILKKDSRKAFYIYQQEYRHKKRSKTRIGFIGLMKIEEPGKQSVLPHERTFRGPKKDRMNLMNEVKANLSPIFSLFEDEGFLVTGILRHAARTSPPFIDFRIEDVHNKLWRLTDRDSIEKIKKLMKAKPIFIADGHHRYEVALAFRNRMRRKGRFKKAFDYTMMYFSGLNQEAITILSTHRVVRSLGGLSRAELISRIREIFVIREFGNAGEMFASMGRSAVRIGLYCGRKKFYTLSPKGPKRKKMLPVALLHGPVLEGILNLKEYVGKIGNIVYTRDEGYALELVDRGGYKAAFFLNPTRVEQFRDAARSRRRMPHKSTYFYPKLLSGLVINKF